MRSSPRSTRISARALPPASATSWSRATTRSGTSRTRYGLEQVGISGLTPEAEPSPADLAEVTRFVEEHDVRTIYFETLVSPDIAEALASETGARTAVLDPIEGLTESLGRRRLPRGDAREPREPPHRAAMPVTARQPCP